MCNTTLSMPSKYEEASQINGKIGERRAMQHFDVYVLFNKITTFQEYN